MSLTIRNVEVAGAAGLDVRLERGRIAAIGPGLAGSGEEMDGAGGALIPGLADHHIHLFALAAQAGSVDVADVRDAAAFARRIGEALAERPAGAWLRVTGWHEGATGELTREALDALAPRHRLRVQHRTGGLWMLNSLGIEALGEGDLPAFVERDPAGSPTGRIWRGDAWLRERIGAEPPPLDAVGARLASYGVTMLTDATATTDPDAATRLAQAHRTGALPQRLTLMSGGPLEAPDDGAFAVGPVKVLLDERALPDLEAFAGRIAQARLWRRAVAVHCVTAAELALTLAAFDAAGARPGDRIEHGGVIPADAIAALKAMGLSVVTQSAFIRERGDRYAAEVAPEDQPDLYRCASLMAAGVPVAGSSDAPYATPDPWVGMASALDRRTKAGLTLGASEAIGPAAALGLYLGRPEAPAGPARRLGVGEAADLCLLKAPLREALAQPRAALVAATFVDGRRVWPV